MNLSLLNPGFIIPCAIVLCVIVFILCGYVKAPPDKAYIISGFFTGKKENKPPRVIIGGASIKIPFFERKDELLIRQISVDVKTNGFVPTKDFIGVDIDAVAKICLKSDKDGIQIAMKNFLNMKEDKIRTALTDSLQGNIREIIGTIDLRELCTDRKKFGDEVQSKAQQDMDELGVKILSFNIQSMTDEQDLISSLGADNMAQIKKDATISKSNAEKEENIAKAQADRESAAARTSADAEIAVMQNELDIKKAELKRQADTKKAEADAAYQIQQETQRKTIETTKVEADTARTEKEIILQQKAAQSREEELNATIKKQAEADKFKREKEAEAMLAEKQRQADAEQYEQGKRAEALKITADAKKYEAQQEAEGIRAKGLAEAEAIRAKGLAEAEAAEKKADAMAKMKEAAVLEMYFNVLPEIAKNIAQPLSAVDKITMFGEGNAAKLIEDITKSTTQVSEGLTQGLGIDIKSVLAGVLGTKIFDNTKNNGIVLDKLNYPLSKANGI